MSLNILGEGGGVGLLPFLYDLMLSLLLLSHITFLYIVSKSISSARQVIRANL